MSKLLPSRTSSCGAPPSNAPRVATVSETYTPKSSVHLERFSRKREKCFAVISKFFRFASKINQILFR